MITFECILPDHFYQLASEEKLCSIFHHAAKLTLDKIIYRLLREIVGDILADSVKRKKILTKCDASDVLLEAFTQTEACMDHYYEVFLSLALT